uniref:threonine--tRNA ligase n=1 Tax=Marseillevirus LCMAC202 TaxID=2506606 RepID=A0A481YYS8_9VIRU|nr:MAG: threonyl-tRNA synthetase [Marseillevirus LCMAC202]
MSLTHQEIGLQQKLFFSDPSSAGSPFFLPHGAHIYNKLRELLRKEYKKRGYQEVISPNIAHVDLWKKSGHYDKYKENMFLFNIGEDNQEFGLKGMNCPLHCIMFNRFNVSYRDLPMRLADFGALHRNELSGALTGLTRVRRFAQDDAHIFCKREDLSTEIQEVLSFMDWFYRLFDFDFELELSTRPENYIGEIEIWNEAETILKRELNIFGKLWQLNSGDGAFYGPKIDVKIKDSLGRSHQCATIQLDFNLPERFELEYQDKDDTKKRPIMIHRAILGSFERFIAILTEHTQGVWPMWLAPRQIAVVPITTKNLAYAKTILQDLREKGYHVELDTTDKHFKTKIRDAEQLQVCHILVVGDKEERSSGVNLRNNGQQRYYSYADYTTRLRSISKPER